MDMDGFELVSLLCSRLCHDLVSPVGAVTNGLEVLADETDAEMREMAMRLITQSADRAAHRLQFARLAYGASGGPDGKVDMGEAKKVTSNVLEDHKVKLNWTCELGSVGRLPAKLLVNAAFLGAESLPRGGVLSAALARQNGETRIEITATGPMVRPIDGMAEIINADMAIATLAPRAAQAYYTGLLARLMGGKLHISLKPEQLSLHGSFAV
jgi:histidine phosphotransferase ChpT